MYVHTEQTVTYLEAFIVHMRGTYDISDLMRILLSIYQIVIGAHDNILKLDSSRYTYGETNEIQFFMGSMLSIRDNYRYTGNLDVSEKSRTDSFIMENFIAKGHKFKNLANVE